MTNKQTKTAIRMPISPAGHTGAAHSQGTGTTPPPGLEILGFEKRTELSLPLYLTTVAAGFPSPADDFIDKSLDLNEHLIDHPAATFFVRVHGDSMIDARLHSGDILIVDRAVDPRNNQIVIAALDGELTVKRIRKKNGTIWLIPENPAFSPTEVTPEMSFEIWGVVTYVIHKV